MKTMIKIKGMHCESCKLLLEDVCREFSGVLACEADVEAGSLKIEHDKALDLDAVKKEIEGVGEYRVEGVPI